MTRPHGHEWSAYTSKADGATANAVGTSRGAYGIVGTATNMVTYTGGPVVVLFKGAPAGRFVDGEWVDVVNPTLANAIAKHSA